MAEATGRPAMSRTSTDDRPRSRPVTSRSGANSKPRRRSRSKSAALVREFLPKTLKGSHKRSASRGRRRACTSDSSQPHVESWEDRQGSFAPLVASTNGWADEKHREIAAIDARGRKGKLLASLSAPSDLEVADALLTLELADAPVCESLLELYHLDESGAIHGFRASQAIRRRPRAVAV